MSFRAKYGHKSRGRASEASHLRNTPATPSGWSGPTDHKATNAIRYALSPTASVIVTPQNTAITTANTDETTEKAPLIPQYQAVGAPFCPSCAFLIPKGKAIPMKNPDGNNKTAESAIRTGVDAAASWRAINGLTTMKAASTTGSNQIHAPTRCA